jgi:RimK-like ATP-grasp domain
MILVCGIPSEPPIARVLDRLAEMGAPTLLFNQREVENCRLAWAVAGGRVSGWLTIADRAYDLTAITGIYARLMDDRALPELDGDLDDSSPRQHSRWFHDQLVAWMDVAPGRVVNRIRSMGSNGSKPYQAQLIRTHGFRVAETLISNDPALVREFHRHHGRVVYKSISGIRSVVAELDADGLERLQHVRACPVQFQAYVPGFDVRVHTIGDEVFATRIDSPETDYRYANHDDNGTRLRPYAASDELARRCCRLSAALGLAFAGIDLRITTDGDVYCFEVNPSPAFSYYEAHTDQPISLGVARHLAATLSRSG